MPALGRRGSGNGRVPNSRTGRHSAARELSAVLATVAACMPTAAKRMTWSDLAATVPRPDRRLRSCRGFGERWHIGSTSRGFSFQTLQCMALLPPLPPLDADTNVLPAVIVAGRRFLSGRSSRPMWGCVWCVQVVSVVHVPWLVLMEGG
jgi:hypothetical protein